MSMRKLAVGAGAAALALGASVALGALALAESPKLGKPITQADLAEWDINILPDGTNLPAGSGKAADGAKIFAQKCVACHGENGQGGVAVLDQTATYQTGRPATGRIGMATRAQIRRLPDARATRPWRGPTADPHWARLDA